MSILGRKFGLKILYLVVIRKLPLIYRSGYLFLVKQVMLYGKL